MSATAQALGRRPIGQRISAIANKYGLYVVLAAAPVYYALHDLITDGTLVPIGNDIFQGLSNGAIWALIALGYTLVYGIIELINFAHGDLFMIGSLISFSFWGWIGADLNTDTIGVIWRLAVTLPIAMLMCGMLNVMIERVG